MTCRQKYFVGALSAEGRELVAQWRKLAIGMAERFIQRARRLRSHRADIISEALLGLVEAARRWTPVRGPFKPYAKWWVRSFILNYDRRGTRVVPLAATQVWRPPSDRSMDAPLSWEDADGLTLHDILGGEAAAGQPPVDETLDAQRLMREAQASLLLHRTAARGRVPTKCQARKDARDAEAYVRNVFGGERLDAIGQDYGLTREAVRQRVLSMQPAFEAWASEVRDEARAA